MDSISHIIEEANQILGFLIYVIFLMSLIKVISHLVSALGLILVVLVLDLAISINKGIRLVFCIPLCINNISSIICV